MSLIDGYILRVTTKQWVNQVFNMAIYYTSIRRKWKSGQVILFMHKTNVGDAIVGYGVIESMREKTELFEDEKQQCEKGGWKRAIDFKYVKRLDKPLSIKETFLKDSKLRGRYFHGLPLNKGQINLILQQAE